MVVCVCVRVVSYPKLLAQKGLGLRVRVDKRQQVSPKSASTVEARGTRINLKHQFHPASPMCPKPQGLGFRV